MEEEEGRGLASDVDVGDVEAPEAFEVQLFSTVTTGGAPRDITAQELRIECFIPADDAPERAIAYLAGG